MKVMSILESISTEDEKLKLTESKILKAVKGAIKYNPNKEIKLYRVGGAVRDEILGVDSKDVDYLVTNVKFDDLKAAIAKISDSIVSTNAGEDMQVIRAIIDGYAEPYDFAIPRTEKYSGLSTHNGVKVFGDPSLPVEKDLSRRDVNFNAIAKDVETGKYIDPFNGLSDIKNRIIKTVGNPSDRYEEDPLRMLRAIQFSVRFDFDIDPTTLKAIKDNLHLVGNISGERIFVELDKAFTKGHSPSNSKLLKLLEITGIGEELFGEEFSPASIHKVVGDKTISNMIALLINGGNFEFMNMSGDMKKYVELARRLKSDESPLSIMTKNGKFMQGILDAALSMDDADIVNKIKSLDGVPLDQNDIDIETEWLMSVGYKGKAIGDIKREIIDMIYAGRLKNIKGEIEKYVINRAGR